MSKETPIFIVGVSGRMGRHLNEVASANGFQVAGGAGRAQLKNLERLIAESSSKAVIDFSLPEATKAVCEACYNLRRPLVSGVTGLNQAEVSELKTLSRSVPVLYSANMSLGIQILLSALEALRPAARDFDFAIEERHHRHKRDQPSGTALLLKSELEATISRRVDQVEALRLGGIVGEHAVIAASEFEAIELKHTAFDRRVFARGALQAARWLVDRGPGFYSLKDVLKDEGKKK